MISPQHLVRPNPNLFLILYCIRCQEFYPLFYQLFIPDQHYVIVVYSNIWNIIVDVNNSTNYIKTKGQSIPFLYSYKEIIKNKSIFDF